MSGIDSAYNLGDHQRLTNWEFSFDDEENFEYRVRSVNLPFFQLSHESTNQGLKFYNGVEHVDTITMELYETIDFRTKQKLDSLRDAVFDFENKVFKSGINPSIAFPTGVLTLYGENDESGEAVVSRIFKFENMRFLGIGEINFSYDDGGPMTYSVTFAVENILEE